MAMLTRGVCRAIPLFLGMAVAEVTTPLAMRPGPPSFSLAKTKIVSPVAIRLPPYMVFCALNVNDVARGSRTAALIAKLMRLVSHRPALGPGLTLTLSSARSASARVRSMSSHPWRCALLLQGKFADEDGAVALLYGDVPQDSPPLHFMQAEHSAPKHRIVHHSSVTEPQLLRTLHGKHEPLETHLTIFADRVLPEGPELP